MEFADVAVKESPGLCRCCLSEGCYKDLGTEYSWMSETEVYADMLLDCFDIGITQHTDGPNGPKRLICEVCITRLRDACNFKKQVVDSEKKFIDMLGRGEFRSDNKTVGLPAQSRTAHMKAEAIEEVTVGNDYDDVNVEFLEDVDYNDDEDLVKLEELAEPKPSTSKRGRPKKTESEVPTKKSKLKAKTKVAKGGNRPEPAESSKAPSELSSTKRNRLIKRNATIIIQHSTAVPFKWHRQLYMCFFCHRQFSVFDKLKEHSNTEHTSNNIKSSVGFMRMDDKVKIDIATLRCKVCDCEVRNVDNLVEHLKRDHFKDFEDSPYGVIPYKFENDSFDCGVCDSSFVYFMKLNQHMNSHFGQCVCSVCGKSFLSYDRLRNHRLIHVSDVRCEHCPKTFPSFAIKNLHIRKCHKQKVVCPQCGEGFVNYTQRKVHMKTAHDVGHLIPCTVCKKDFSCKSRMLYHLREVHYKETNFHCSLCEQGFFSHWQLRAHVRERHANDDFQCKVCCKSFATESSLNKHTKTHKDKSESDVAIATKVP